MRLQFDLAHNLHFEPTADKKSLKYRKVNQVKI
jgi:hypothetical protein